MEPKQIVIRPARPEDAPVAARLQYLAGPGIAMALFGKPESNAIRVLTELFPIPDHMFSYTHACVAERDDQVVGLLLGFDGKTMEAAERAAGRIGFRLFKIIRPWHIPRLVLGIIDLERASVPVSDEEWLVQMIAVLPEVRRQGIGRQLMEFAESQAQSKGLKKLVLDVIVENEGARRFYERLGFQAVKTVTDARFCRRFGIQGSIHMVKSITNSTEGGSR